MNVHMTTPYVNATYDYDICICMSHMWTPQSDFTCHTFECHKNDTIWMCKSHIWLPHVNLKISHVNATHKSTQRTREWHVWTYMSHVWMPPYQCVVSRTGVSRGARTNESRHPCVSQKKKKKKIFFLKLIKKKNFPPKKKKKKHNFF